MSIGFRQLFSRTRPPRPAAAPKTEPVQIIVTPGSGEGRALRTARRLIRLLAQDGRHTNIRSFANLEGLRRWAAECAPDFSHLICIGGDGTLSAAARAAIRLGVPLVPVPNGFGNIFASVFGHPRRARAVVSLLETGQVRRIDVGVVGDGGDAEVFLSHQSYGVLHDIQAAAERGRQQPRNRLLRYFWYYAVAYQFAVRRRLSTFAVEVDGQRVADDAVLVAVANVETYHGFLPLAPKASPIDGLFDVAIIPRVSHAGLWRRLLWLFLRLPGWSRVVTRHRGRRVVVSTSQRRDELRVVRRALPLLVSSRAYADLAKRTLEGQ